MSNIRKFLIISFTVILSVVFVSAIAFFISPIPTTQFFKLVSKNVEYVDPQSTSFKELSYVVATDISYDSSLNNGYFDIYTPKDVKGIKPTILWVHGGTYVSGDKKDLETFLPYFANEGYVVVSINYEQAPHAKFPNPIKQITEAYNYIYEHATLYNIDLDNFFIGGDSVGAEMVSQFVNIQQNKQYSQLLSIKKVDNPINIKGVILYYGTFELENLAMIHELSKLFFDHMKWTYLGSRKWSKDEYLNNVDISSNIINYPPTYITDVSRYEYAQEGKKISKVLSNKTTFFPNDKYGKNFPFEYQFYLEGKKNDKVLKEVALENFNNTLNFINSLIS